MVLTGDTIIMGVVLDSRRKKPFVVLVVTTVASPYGGAILCFVVVKSRFGS